MTRVSGETCIPTHPSNRNVIKQMEKWGWENQGPIGRNWITMYFPLAGLDLAVRPATYHDGNPSEKFTEIYRITTGGDAEKFWRGPVKPTLAAVPDIPNAKEVAVENRIINQVRDALIGASRPIHLHRLSEQLGLENGQVSSALTELKRRNQVKRLGKGMYVIEDNLKVSRHEHEHHGDAGLHLTAEQPVPVEVIAHHPSAGANITWEYDPHPMSDRVVEVTVQPAPPSVVQQGWDEHVGIVTNPSQVLDKRTASQLDEDGTIEAMLDLLSPDGFKAKDLRAIRAWEEATRALIRNLNS